MVGSDERGPMSAGTFTDIAARQHSFSRLAAFYGIPVDLAYVADQRSLVPIRAAASRVSG